MHIPSKTIASEYYQLVKPGIVYGNALNATAGFFLASRGDIEWALLLFTLTGLSLIVASSCVVNNYFDRFLDTKMERTKNRALATGRLPIKSALLYALALAILGIGVLLFLTNAAALNLALFGALMYIGVYTFAKRSTPFATELGSIAGAMPPLVGYVAVSGGIDKVAVILFLIYALWQMPHFFAIAIFRKDDYAAAGIPVLPVRHSIHRTKLTIFFYILCFSAAVVALAYAGFAGPIYLAVMGSACALWIALSLWGFFIKSSSTDAQTKYWARQMFYFSLIVVLLLCVTLILQR